MTQHTDVAIVGAGPVGTLLAILLGKRGVKVTLIERWPTLYDRPRAVTMDHEVARILATFGIDANDDPLIAYFDELYYWKNAERENLQIVDWKSVSPSGWRVTYWFNQPELETRLLGIAADIPEITLLRGWQAIDIEQDASGVTLALKETEEIRGPDGESDTVRAAYVVGCDGANSFVRERLEIPVVDKGYFFDWLILDMVPDSDYVCSPAQWQLCDPRRPTTIVPGGPGRRRWEFMVLPGESADEIATEDSAWRLLEPWGLTPHNARLERSAVYRFQARWADTWRRGRCLIAGDAAHLMPPFAGEGMCAGFRDAVNLAWRLAAVVQGTSKDALLDSYATERIPHARHYIDFSQELGNIICIADPDEAAERDRTMMAALAARNGEPLNPDHVSLGPGVLCADTPAAGELSVQGVVDYAGKRDRFDQAVGQGWFILGIEADPVSALSSTQRDCFARLGGRVITVGETGGPWDVIDTDGTYKRWRRDINRAFVILRPDFYVAATADSHTELAARLDEILTGLHLTQGHEAVHNTQ